MLRVRGYRVEHEAGGRLQGDRRGLEVRVREFVGQPDPAQLARKEWELRAYDEPTERSARPRHPASCHDLHVLRQCRDLCCMAAGASHQEHEAVDAVGHAADVLRQCLQSAKTDGENLTYSIINAFEAGATIGEISGALRMAYNWPYDHHDMIEPMI